MARFADVILPLALPGNLTYEIPPPLQPQVHTGSRVVVSVGKSRLYTAVVRRLHETAPAAGQIKPILEVVDSLPVVHAAQMEFWEWMSSYYLCTSGEVMSAAIPAGLKLTSESRIVRNENSPFEWETLTDKEFLLMEALDIHTSLTLDEVSEILGIKTIQPVIRAMLDKDLVRVEQELRDRYKPRYETYVRLSAFADNEENLPFIMDGLSRAPKQLELLMHFIRLSNRYVNQVKELPKKAVLNNGQFSDTVLKELAKKEILEEVKVEVGRLQSELTGEGIFHELTPAQDMAWQQIRDHFEENRPVLLHGVTSSGKTEIYARLIADAVKQGKQVLYLVPEIALTTQLVSRLKRAFSGHIGVYHSRFNEHERVEIWKKVLEFVPGQPGPYQVIIGARSSIFLPFSDLGLIIVDEEHENSYKQHDPAPRYHARDAAIYLAGKSGARILLGSATPSLESYYNALHGKYGLVELGERHGGVQLPAIYIVDLEKAWKEKLVQAHFSRPLAEEMEKALAHREQVILFQNRRGFSLITQCQVCRWTPMCKNCDITLTYHKQQDVLKCHYCGYSMRPPDRCGACGSMQLTRRGTGTERVEEEAADLFPTAVVGRLDIDAGRRKNGIREILDDFANGMIHILAGTQMVSKGLDFDNVSVVGIINADQMFYFPDFRAHERAYQLMAQVAGRAGRRKKQGKVFIQTYSPSHPVLNYVISHNYRGFYDWEIAERLQFQYPPFTRLIRITLRHKEFDHLRQAATWFSLPLKEQFGQMILGPEVPGISRLKNKFLMEILIKAPRGSLAEVKAFLWHHTERFKADVTFRNVDVVFDVDPG